MKFMDSAWFKWVKAIVIMIGLSFLFAVLFLFFEWISLFIHPVFIVMVFLFASGTYLVHGTLK